MSSKIPQTTEPSGTDQIDSMATSSSEIWSEVLERLQEVEQGHRRLADAVDHLGVVVSHALVEETQADRASDPGATSEALPDELFSWWQGAPEVTVPQIPEPAKTEVAETPVAKEKTKPAKSAKAAHAPESQEDDQRGLAPLADATESKVQEPERAWLSDRFAAVQEAPFGFVEPADQPITEPAFGAGPEPASTLGTHLELSYTETPFEAQPEPLIEPPTEPTSQVAQDEPVVEVGDVEPDEKVPTVHVEETIEIDASALDELLAFERSKTEDESSPETDAPALVDVGAAAAFAPETDDALETEQQSAIRVLAPDASPELVDALLAAEFGEAAARLMDPTLTLDGLLGEEFATPDPTVPPSPRPSEPLAEQPFPTLPSPPTSKETPLPPPPSQLLPPPPSNLLPPPTSTTDGPPAPPQPTWETSAHSDTPSVSTIQAVSYVQVSPAPVSYDSPPVPAKQVEQTEGEVPSASEPALPSSPPPIPPPVASEEAPVTEPQGLEKTVGASDLPSLFAPQETVAAETPPVAEEPAPPVEEPARSEGLPSFMSAASMATEVLSATPEPERHVPSAESAWDESSGAKDGDDHAGPNLVSQDFTFRSKKHKRFRLR